MKPDEGIELQHRGKPAEASVKGCDGISEEEPSDPSKSTNSPKTATRHLDVSNPITPFLVL